MTDVLTPLTCNGAMLNGARFRIPWRGAWEADIDLVLDPTTILPSPPSGKVVLVVGSLALLGTVDPTAAGTFGTRIQARVQGGAGNWGAYASPQHFYQPGTTATVFAATAQAVGETCVVPLPELIPEHFARAGGPARDVFGDRDWYVNPATGITFVAPWAPTILLDTQAQVIDFDITEMRVKVASNEIILPGTVLSDPQFNGQTYIVRDVEMVFGKDGGMADLWLAATPQSRLADSLKMLVRSFSNWRYLKTYKYRVVIQSGEMLTLQGITPDAPDMNPLEQWTGLAGAFSQITPGGQLVMGFAGASPSDPYIVSYQNDTGQLVYLGGLSGAPVARVGDSVLIQASGLVAPAGVQGGPVTGMAKGTITSGSAKVTA